MSEFRQQFLSQSIDSLAKLRQEFAVGDVDSSIRNAFRVVHTIKGGAQTFGLETVARSSGEIEDLLTRCKDPLILQAELESLAAHLSGEPLDESAFNVEANPATAANVTITSLPREYFEKLASSEKDAFARAVRGGLRTFLIDVTLKTDALSGFFRTLARQSEVVATIAKESSRGASSMSFSIVAVADRYPEFPEYELSIRQLDDDSPNSSVLAQIFYRLAVHVDEISGELGKSIALDVFANPVTADAASDKLFPILLHLVRNAADHGIDKRGTIEINCFEDENDWFLSVSDDGRGIDIDAVHSRAVALGLLSGSDAFDEEIMLARIFEHGFSTSRTVNEISGRGVGLDFVKTSVDALNGRISVRNRKKRGTIFTVVLPKESL